MLRECVYRSLTVELRLICTVLSELQGGREKRDTISKDEKTRVRGANSSSSCLKLTKEVYEVSSDAFVIFLEIVGP